MVDYQFNIPDLNEMVLNEQTVKTAKDPNLAETVANVVTVTGSYADHILINDR